MKILIVEDEDTIRQQLTDFFTEQKFVVDARANAEEGFYMAQEFEYDALIVDLNLPKMQGIDLIKKIRKNDKKYPVLVLTARDLWQNKVEVLDAGADDYVTKPFHMEEILARVNALIRRDKNLKNKSLKAEGIEFDLERHKLIVDNKDVALTALEFKILRYLMLNSEKVISRNTLLDYIYPDGDYKESNVLDVCISRLRSKLDPTGERKIIETIRGAGYRFNAPLI